MSDIVEQLRYFGSQMYHEAADEITRLRDQLHLAEVARAAQVEGVVQAAAGWRERANQLEAQVAALTVEYDHAVEQAAANCDEVLRLRERVAALEGDAGRYRWLRDNSCPQVMHPSGYGMGNPRGEQLDNAIDAALAARKGAA